MRTIASEVRIASDQSRDFPGARDTVAMMGADLSLVTAAHNSARFPFVNAIGAVDTPRDRCPRSGEGAAAGAGSAPDAHKSILCGHVADGGYFDNSGSQTVIDILRKLRSVLFDPANTALADDKVRSWARQALVPRIVFLHNDSPKPCHPPQEFHQPDRQQVECRNHGGAAGDSYRPQPPTARGALTLYSDMLGVPVTAVNATGLAANRLRADSLAIEEVEELNRLLSAGRNVKSGEPSQLLFDQVRYGGGKGCEQGLVVYPLGWYLSEKARTCMEQQAEEATSRLIFGP